MKIYGILLPVLVGILSFSIYAGKISANSVKFTTDEAYWISTAKIIPLLSSHDFNNPFWKEYYGFVNFNGAKFIYGLGLPLLGITNVDIAGTPPDTYYRWVAFENKPFPQNNSFFPIIKSARYISACVTAISVTLFMVLLYIVFTNMIVSIIGGVMLFIHPISVHVATHALADSFFIFFEILLLILLSLRLRGRLVLMVTGFTLAYLTSIKLNGTMFIPVIFMIYVVLEKKGLRKKGLMEFAVVTVISIFIFLLLHPNFFFYPGYTPLQMIADRVRITQQHIVYFSRISPGHVILDIPGRINSFLKSSFTWWLIPLFLLGSLNTFLKKSSVLSLYNKLVMAGMLVFASVISYTVFDEPRYYLPVLPFIIIISVNWILTSDYFFRPILQRFRHVG